MPPDFPLLIVLGVLAIAILIVGVLWWRVRRNRSEDTEIPLYSVTVTNDPLAASARAPLRSALPTPAAAPVERPRPAAPVSKVPPSAAVATDVSPTPASASPVPETSAASSPGGRRQRVEFSTAPVDADALPDAHAPERPDRERRSRRDTSRRKGGPDVRSSAESASAVTPLPDSRPITAHGVPGTEVEGHLLRFSVPQEGTLQFLPGRLEILSGRDAGREIRFVRVPGPDGTTVTFGRSEGPAYRHIQLREATVSRLHARLRLEEGIWHLTNLSETNPVVMGGRLMTRDEEIPVADGDRIEMGEVVFGFRSR